MTFLGVIQHLHLRLIKKMRLGGLLKRGCKFTVREEEEVLVFHDRE